ncbi:MAG: hypothetical protein ACRENG_14885 [bacterium]
MQKAADTRQMAKNNRLKKLFTVDNPKRSALAVMVHWHTAIHCSLQKDATKNLVDHYYDLTLNTTIIIPTP